MKKEWILATAGIALTGLAAWVIRSTKKENEGESPCDCEENAAPAPLDRQKKELETDEDEDICYWAQKGGVWHRVSDCGYLAHTDNVQSGTQEQARQAGKTRACSSCAL